MSAEAKARMRQFEAFLREQDLLDETMAAPLIFEPVVLTKKDKIVFGGAGIRIDSFVKLEGGLGLHIGRGVHIASFAHVGIGGGVTHIGDYAAVASGARLVSGSNQMDAISMSASAPADIQRVEASFVRMEPYSCVLVNSCVLPGVTLHEGAILGAGAVATKDIPAWEVWVGSPARFLKMRPRT